jgi:cell division protein FtsB
MLEDLNSLQDYRNLVLQYEDANAQINALFQVHQGGTETMTDDELAHYRKLQHRRDELFNEMRVLEQELLDEDAQ